MKKIIYIFFLTFSLYAQSQIINLTVEDDCNRDVRNAYYSDADNSLDGFEGSWKYQNGNEILIITLLKILNAPNNLNSQDLLIGEYKYIDAGGNLIFDTLNDLNVNYTDQTMHSIFGNCVFSDYNYPEINFLDCIPTMKKVKLLHFYENLGGGPIYLAIKNQGSINQIKIYINTDTNNYQTTTDVDGYEDLIVTPTNRILIPNGYYVLTKI